MVTVATEKRVERQQSFEGITEVGTTIDKVKANKTAQTSASSVVEVKGLTVGSKWRVGSDSDNIIVFSRKVNKLTGKERFSAVAYFSTVGNALAWLVEQGARETNLVDLETVVGKVEELKRDILKLYA